nr:thioredoxin domain-containing protein [Terrihabitans soli]
MTKNRLAGETSPYLRQHADNPVHWWPWSPEALEEAKRSNRPILLSVGYAACHWCHVMAHESFEDEATAEVMNELYVNIKVDREERPDVDQVNMAALHAMGQQGGWPLTMFLTPDGKPFFGGTYFPNKPQYGRPSFVDVLRGVAQTFREREGDVATNANVIEARIRPQPIEGTIQLTRRDLDSVSAQLAGVMDPVHGGPKGAPKFPNTPLLEFLWRAGDRTGDPKFRQIFLHTLDRISQGGMYDHIGGGYARYSVDELWLVPHFEKMLYDNAQILELLALAFQTSGSDLFRRRAAETVAWLEREMVLPGGGFASSLDADSEGHEGKFYVWTKAEVDKALGAEDGAFFARAYDITPDGNFEGTSIPSRLTAAINDADEPRLAALRAKLLAARAVRIRPGLDDKILADWNGLMIAALVRAGLTFSKPDWVALAERAFGFIIGNMERGGRLGHSFRDGRLIFPGFASDLASMARAATALYEGTGKAGYLAKAEAWIAGLDENHDSLEGAYYLTAKDGEALAVRPGADKDEAVASATGLALETKFRLAALTGKDVYRETADVSMARISVAAAKNVFGHLSALNALDTRLAGLEVLIVGDGDGQLIAAAKKLPFIARTVRSIKDASALPDSHPAKALAASSGAKALVCAGEVCGLPVTTPEALSDSANALRRGTAQA